MSDAAEEFRFEPLRQVGEFRILELHPAESDIDGIQIDIRTESLENAPDYGAISYTWDAQSFEKEIIVNGKKFQITQNCRDILLLLRRKDKPRFLWMDQICINQASNDDRSHNVKRMAEIYEKANQVFVWTGNLDSQTLDLLYRMAYGNQSAYVPDDLKDGHHSMLKSSSKGYELQEGDRQTWDRFSTRSWFQRMWTLQEIATARRNEVVLLTGKQPIPFVYLFAEGEKIVSVTSLSTHLSIVLWGKLDPDTSDQAHFSEIIGITLSRLCSEPKDKIFALYSMIEKAWKKRRPQESFNFPEPDYSKGVAEVYPEAVTWAITQDNDLKILYYAPVTQSMISGPSLASFDGVVEGLPTWVPDLYRLAPLKRRLPKSGFLFSHQENVPSKPAQSPRVSFDPPLLYLRGRVDDIIHDVGTEMPDLSDLSALDLETFWNKFSTIVNILEDWFVRMELAIPEGNENSFDHEICEILLNGCDSTWFGKPTPALMWCIQYFKEKAKASLGDTTAGSEFFRFMFEFYESDPPEVRNWNTFQVCAQSKIDKHLSSLASVLWSLGSHCYLITNRKRAGVAFGAVERADVIARISGLDRPLILRRKGPLYTLVGYAHIPVISREEALPSNPALLQEIILE